MIPDAATAVEIPRTILSDHLMSQRLLDAAPGFPTMTWGRDEQHLGDMWNSNSPVAWLLTVSGHDVGPVGLPAHGRAPGWNAGLVAGQRSLATAGTPELLPRGSRSNSQPLAHGPAAPKAWEAPR